MNEAPGRSVRDRGPLFALLAFALVCQHFLLHSSLVAGRIGPPLDDGWIYMAFARSMAAGEGITYPGHDGPVAAVTGPIWCAVLALGIWGAGAKFWVVAALGMLTGAVAVLGVHRLARQAGLGVVPAGVAAVIFALNPRFAWGCLSGMEVPFYVAGTVWGIAGHLRYRGGGVVAWTLGAALPLAAAGWSRPECLVLPLLAAAHRFLVDDPAGRDDPVAPRPPRWRRLDGLATAALLVAVYPAYHLIVTGHPLPTTFYVKAAGNTPLTILRTDGATAALTAWAGGVGLQIEGFFAWLGSHLPWLALGLLTGWRRGLRERNGVPVLVAVVLLFAIARGSLGFAMPWFQQGRYFAHLWPLLLIVGVHGFDLSRRGWMTGGLVAAALTVAFVLEFDFALVGFFDVVQSRDGGVGGGMVPLARVATLLVHVPAIAFAAFALLGVVLAGRTKRLPAAPPLWLVLPWLLVSVGLGGRQYARGVDDTYGMNVAVAKKVAELVPAGETVACHDLGALGFFADRPLLDLAGLGSPEIAFREREPGQPLDRIGVLAEMRPRYVCVTDSMLDAINPGGGAVPGLTGMVPLAEVRKADNVTVLGDVFFLLELRWAPK